MDSLLQRFIKYSAFSNGSYQQAKDGEWWTVDYYKGTQSSNLTKLAKNEEHLDSNAAAITWIGWDKTTCDSNIDILYQSYVLTFANLGKNTNGDDWILIRPTSWQRADSAYDWCYSRTYQACLFFARWFASHQIFSSNFPSFSASYHQGYQIIWKHRFGAATAS